MFLVRALVPSIRLILYLIRLLVSSSRQGERKETQKNFGSREIRQLLRARHTLDGSEWWRSLSSCWILSEIYLCMCVWASRITVYSLFCSPLLSILSPGVACVYVRDIRNSRVIRVSLSVNMLSWHLKLRRVAAKFELCVIEWNSQPHIYTERLSCREWFHNIPDIFQIFLHKRTYIAQY